MKSKILPLLLMIAATSTYASQSNANSDHRESTRAAVSCTFGTCSASIASAAQLDVSCDGKSVYSGTYTMDSDLATVQIQATTSDGPKITTQAMPSSGKPTAATLVVSGQSYSGTCSN